MNDLIFSEDHPPATVADGYALRQAIKLMEDKLERSRKMVETWIKSQMPEGEIVDARKGNVLYSLDRYRCLTYKNPRTAWAKVCEEFYALIPKDAWTHAQEIIDRNTKEYFTDKFYVVKEGQDGDAEPD